ncbi:GMC oxidoreductase-domain-containing protein [Favolaschia claudopus]|uniref:GMC oxidoreductase-domain-containing protein n=1 Tax=Favolaschia claudopus TaxID=2862362 RepID=A0AAW0A4X9_9AGAR
MVKALYHTLLCLSFALSSFAAPTTDSDAIADTDTDATQGATIAASSASSKVTYIVVGGGTAGLAVATRLSENSANTVIVIEAGSDGFDNPNIANLTGPSIQALPGTSVDYNYQSLPLKYASNQIISMTRGQVLGGSSALNGALFTRPNKIDFDLWETAFGASGWYSESTNAVTMTLGRDVLQNY